MSPVKTYEEIVKEYKKRQHDTVVDTIATGLTYMDEVAVDSGLLEETGVDFMRTDHPEEPATSMEVCEKVDAILGVRICKNLFLCNRQKTNFYLLVMPGDKPFKTKELSGQLGISRLSFGEPQYMEEFMDLQPGSVSVLGLMNDHDHRVRLLIDEDVLEEEQFGCHPCMNTSSIRFATKDLVDKILPAIGVGYTTVKLVGY